VIFQQIRRALAKIGEYKKFKNLGLPKKFKNLGLPKKFKNFL